MMTRFRRLSFVALFLLQTLAASFVYGRTIAIYHTSDVHGVYGLRRSGESEPPRMIGGYSVLSKLRKDDPTPSLLVDSGDWFQGTPEGNFSKGQASIAIMNKMQYNAVLIGNHDFDFGEQNLADLLKDARFPILGANILNNNSGKIFPYVAPYYIANISGVKIAIIGVEPETLAQSIAADAIPNVAFGTSVKALSNALSAVRKEGVNAVILLTHQTVCKSCAFTVDGSKWKPTPEQASVGSLALVRAVQSGRIAAVFGGHKHLTMTRGYFDPKSKATFFESGAKLRGVTRVELEFDDTTNQLKGVRGGIINLWADKIGVDQDIENFMKPIFASVGPQMDQPVGQASVDLMRYTYTPDSPLGNWMTDLMRQVTGAQVGLQNLTGIRGDIKQGPITPRTIYNICPFDNSIVSLDIDGKQLFDFVSVGLRNGPSFMQVSGIAVQYRIAADGTTPTDITMKVNGRPLDPNATYRVATSDYLAGKLMGNNVNDTGLLLRDTMLEAVRRAKVLNRPQGFRIKILK